MFGKKLNWLLVSSLLADHVWSLSGPQPWSACSWVLYGHLIRWGAFVPRNACPLPSCRPFVQFLQRVNFLSLNMSCGQLCKTTCRRSEWSYTFDPLKNPMHVPQELVVCMYWFFVQQGITLFRSILSSRLACKNSLPIVQHKGCWL